MARASWLKSYTDYSAAIQAIDFRPDPLDGPELTDDAPLPHLESLERFRSHPWVKESIQEYYRCYKFYKVASLIIVDDLWVLNEEYKLAHQGRAIFAACDSRVKKTRSYMNKLYKSCCEVSRREGLTRDVFDRCARQIHDIVGARFCVPYVDQVLPMVQEVVRPGLARLHYAMDLTSEACFADRNYLQNMRPDGYRSYHFFVKIPVTVDLFNRTEMCLCEVQARSELQHVWAVKSHDLFYKPNGGWVATDNRTTGDMVSIGALLDQVDNILVNLRDRRTGEANR